VCFSPASVSSPSTPGVGSGTLSLKEHGDW